MQYSMWRVELVFRFPAMALNTLRKTDFNVHISLEWSYARVQESIASLYVHMIPLPVFYCAKLQVLAMIHSIRNNILWWQAEKGFLLSIRYEFTISPCFIFQNKLIDSISSYTHHHGSCVGLLQNENFPVFGWPQPINSKKENALFLRLFSCTYIFSPKYMHKMDFLFAFVS